MNRQTTPRSDADNPATAAPSPVPTPPRLTATLSTLSTRSSEHPGSRSSDGGPWSHPSPLLRRPSEPLESTWTNEEQQQQRNQASYHEDEHPSPTSDEMRDAVWGRSSSDDDDSDGAPRPGDKGPPRKSGTSSKKLQRTHSTTTGKSFLRSIISKFTKAGKHYGYVPQTEQERDRNAIQHQVILDLFDDRHHLAPVVKPRAVLDLGSAPGLWAVSVAKLTTARRHSAARRHPQCAVVGVDLEKVRPPNKPPNCQFHQMDFTKDWTLDGRRFDFIHARMLGDVADKKQLIRHLQDHLKPGGWVEFTEWITVLHTPDHSLEGTAFHDWNKLLAKGLENLGHSIDYPLEYKALLDEAGFERVIVTKLAAPTNACYPGKKAQRVGKMMTSNWNAILEPLSLPVLTHGLGWNEFEVHSLLKEVRKELGDPKYHSFMTLLTIYCRMPRRNGSTTSVSNSSFSASTAALALSSTTSTTSG